MPKGILKMTLSLFTEQSVRYFPFRMNESVLLLYECFILLSLASFFPPRIMSDASYVYRKYNFNTQHLSWTEFFFKLLNFSLSLFIFLSFLVCCCCICERRSRLTFFRFSKQPRYSVCLQWFAILFIKSIWPCSSTHKLYSCVFSHFLLLYTLQTSVL